jgi:hypothetical protein
MIPKAVIRTDHFAGMQSDVLSRNRTRGCLVARVGFQKSQPRLNHESRPKGAPERSEGETAAEHPTALTD